MPSESDFIALRIWSATAHNKFVGFREFSPNKRQRQIACNDLPPLVTTHWCVMAHLGSISKHSSIGTRCSDGTKARPAELPPHLALLLPRLGLPPQRRR